LPTPPPDRKNPGDIEQGIFIKIIPGFTALFLDLSQSYISPFFYHRDFVFHFSTDNRSYVYASGNALDIGGFSVNGSTGVLTALPGSPFDFGNTPTALTADNTGRLFAAIYNAGQVRVFTTSGGVPGPVTGTRFLRDC
jgi:hypothetical protein